MAAKINDKYEMMTQTNDNNDFMAEINYKMKCLSTIMIIIKLQP